MDKNTILGFVLIGAILLGFSLLNKPNETEIALQQRYNDSIALVQEANKAVIANQKNASLATVTDSISKQDTVQLADAYGAFDVAAKGNDTVQIIENELIKLEVANKGGRIVSVQLKKFQTHDSLPLLLFDATNSKFGLTLVTNNNRVINTGDLFFEPAGGIVKDSKGNQRLTMRLKTSGAASLDFVYSLPANDYMVGVRIKANAMNMVMPMGINSLEMQWAAKIRQQEKGHAFEDRYSQLHYKFLADDVETLSQSKDEEKKLSNKIKWIAYSGQFFSSILIADESIASANLKSTKETEETGFIKSYSSDMVVPFDPSGTKSTDFKFFFGPNQYKILSGYDKDLTGDEQLKLRAIIPLGWGIFGWVNRFMIIPMFDFFSKYIFNFGIIILLMTFAIKMLLFPLTYKSYISSAKMRVLKPEIDEINARIPADKMAERQKATMELYNKVGVSPMSGCLPTLLQMPILFAMFSFFPAAIELRQQSFLWANDLSSYDAIVSWTTYIPLVTPYFGNHISLFTLLMTVTTIVYTKLNMANTPTTDQMGGAMMKWMMYLMPVMFMFMFNGYAAGLSYYYFISTLISIAQTYVIRATVDEKKMLAQLHAKRNSKKVVKRSGFMERLEKMQREQQNRLKGKK
ncbi:MAG: membrane protein insertase YidC [Porphyromonadaceae bacterium CG2_30_38_12]|nr:MAG: membrane protein insertase YidC [Porphyromonadaceae bacterium CG2_30_38_12]